MQEIGTGKPCFSEAIRSRFGGVGVYEFSLQPWEETGTMLDRIGGEKEAADHREWAIP
jgi:hypothetical protein